MPPKTAGHFKVTVVGELLRKYTCNICESDTVNIYRDLSKQTYTLHDFDQSLCLIFVRLIYR